MECKQKIIDEVNECQNGRFLEFLYRMILSFKKKVGHLVPLFLVPIGYIVENSSPVFRVKDF